MKICFFLGSGSKHIAYPITFWPCTGKLFDFSKRQKENCITLKRGKNLYKIINHGSIDYQLIINYIWESLR